MNQKQVKKKSNSQRRISIRSLLTISLLCVSIAPPIIVGYILYEQSAETMYKRIENYSNQIVELSAQQLSNKLSDLDAYGIETAYSYSVQEYLENPTSMTSWERNQLLANIRQEHSIKVSRQNEDFVVSIIEPNQIQTIIYGNHGLPFMLKPDIQKDVFDQATQLESSVYLLPTTEDMQVSNIWLQQARTNNSSTAVIMARSIKSLYMGDVLGVILIRVSERYINQLYSSIDLGSGSQTFLMGDNGLIYASPTSFLKLANTDYSSIQTAFQTDEKANQVGHWNDGQKDYFVFSAPIIGYPMNLVSLLPAEYINSELNQTALAIVGVMLVMAVGLVIVSTGLAWLLANPLRKLVRSMNAARDGNLSITMPGSGIKEVESVSYHFNVMMNDINQLIANVKDQEQKKRLAELKALQAQINPHFLGNTLNTVRWMAQIQGASNIDELIGSLIHLINSTLGSNDDLIPIREEVENIKTFIKIQEYRYYDKFTVQYQIEPDILDYKIPRLLLQPIVENALIHGIAPIKGQGTLVIKGLQDHGDIRLQITDNGRGISSERLAEIEAGLDPTNNHGIGINNVRSRIKRYFGEAYGITLTSVPDLYTVVEVTLPAIQVIDKENSL